MNPPQKRHFALVAFSILLISVLGGLSVWFYRSQQKAAEQKVAILLAAVVQSKVKQLAAWRQDRLATAVALLDNPILTAAIRSYLHKPGKDPAAVLHASFASLLKHYQYSDIYLMDRQGQIRLHVGENPHLECDLTDLLLLVCRQPQVHLTALHGQPVSNLHVAIMAPVAAGDDDENQQPDGIVLLISRASHFLFPLLQDWPVPTQTGELVLVHREGDEALVIHGPPQPEESIRLERLPLTQRANPCTQAALGHQGLLIGQDEKDEMVFAMAASVPASDWFLVAKIAAAEALSPWRQRTLFLLGLFLGLILTGSMLALFVYQHQQKIQFQAMYRQEAEMQATARRHSQILNAIGDGVIAVDGRGRIEMLNPVAAELTGWPVEEAVGRDLQEVFQIINEETREPATNPVDRVLQEGVVVGLANHTVLIDRQGNEHYITDSGAPVYDAQGQISGAVLVFRDKTAKRVAEHLMEFRLELIHFAASHTSVAMVQWALEQMQVLVQSPCSFCQILDPEQGTVLLEHWSPPTWQAELLGADHSGQPSLVQTSLGRKLAEAQQPLIINDYQSFAQNRGEAPLPSTLQRLLLVPIRRQGKLVAIFGVGNKPSPYSAVDADLGTNLGDITWQLVNQKRLEEELYQSHIFLDSIIENIPHMIFIKDAKELRFVRFNRAGEQLLGYSRAELLGKNDYDFFPVAEADFFTSKDREVLAQRKVVNIPQEPIQTRYQGQRWLHTIKVPLLGSEGEPAYLLGISEDITEQLRLTKTLELVAASSSQDPEEIFRMLARETAQILQARGTLIGRLTPDHPPQVETLAVYRDGEFAENFTFPLKATPIGLVTDQQPCVIPPEVRRLFPQPLFLVGTETAGYWGLYLTNRAGRAIGLMAISGSPHLKIAPQTLSVLQILLARAAAEIERQAGLDELQDQQAFLRLVIDSVDAFICVKHLDGRYILANQALARAYGTRVVDLEGRRDEDFCPNLEQCRKFRQDDRRVILERRLIIIPEEQITYADGSQHWLTTVKRPLIDPAGTCDKLLAVAMDITPRKQAEAEKDLLLAAIQQAGEAIVITDATGAIQYVNPAFEEVTGYRKEEVLGQNPRILKSGQHDQEFYQNLWQTITSGLIWRGRIVNRRRDGTLFTEEATISPVFDDKGRIVNFLAVKKNITQELEMARQLHQAQRLESIGRMAGGLAHDFNNMLSVIIGYTELLEKDTPTDHPHYELLEEIRRASLRSRALTHQLLAFGRQQSQQLQVLDLNMVITQLARMLQRIIGEDIELVSALAPNLGAVRADPSQVEQVLMNLVVNARDAMPTGGRLTIRTRNVDLPEADSPSVFDVPPGPYVMIEVKDTGLGMDDDTRSKIFDPFFTTKEPGHGTGLGLSTVYGIIKQSGGDIRCESEPGRGTTFTIVLPRLATPAQPKGVLASELPQALRGQQEYILVVEDEEPVRKLLQSMLRVLNYRAVVATDGIEALRLVMEEGLRPDLILTDAIMPKMGGKELIAAIHQHLPDLKVIFMSGYVDERAGPNSLGPDVPFLQKPFSLTILAAKLREVLEGKATTALVGQQ